MNSSNHDDNGHFSAAFIKELGQVEHPGRYLGGEIGIMKPRPGADGRIFRVALAFPDVYDIAHGHLGHKIIYSQLNQTPGFAAERVYAPWPDRENQLRNQGVRLASLESRAPLKNFDLIGFSLQYELSYTNILNMLQLGGLPLRAKERSADQPLVMGGGPGAYNPEPLADFFDLFHLGDSEADFMASLAIIRAWRLEKKAPRSELYDRLAGRPGLYIPSLFQPVYGPEGRLTAIEPLKPGCKQVVRSAAPDLRGAPFPTCQIVPFIKPVHDRIAVEIARGCSQGCRFCQAGFVYRPVRERGMAEVLELAGQNLKNTGQDEVSFLALSAGDHSQIEPMLSSFMDSQADRGVALSLPSLRVKSLTAHLAGQIRRVRKTGFTLAPEAGSQRLRNVINKRLTEDDVLGAAELAYSLGWRLIKFYFMVGLPTEDESDLLALADLARRAGKMGRGRLNIGLSHFVPKAHTPFQWEGAASAEDIGQRLLFIQKALKTPGLTPKWNAPGASWVEGLLARGGRPLGRVLQRVYEKGARFEAWMEFFQPRLWEEALEELGFRAEELARPRQAGEILPYRHLSAGVQEQFLWRERLRAYQGQTTGDCRAEGCQGCGACQDGLRNVWAEPPAGFKERGTRISTERPEAESREASAAAGHNYLLSYAKKGPAALISHLETAEAFKRALRRAGIEPLLSRGFHPQPKLSFFTPLALGLESLQEYFKLSLKDPLDPEDLFHRLKKELPPGFELKTAARLPAGRAKIKPRAVRWRLTADKPGLFYGPCRRPELKVKNQKGRWKSYDLAALVQDIQPSADGLEVDFTIIIKDEGLPKPRLAAAGLFGLEEEVLAGARLLKLATILD